jgi:PAS domain S-box-containing protein
MRKTIPRHPADSKIKPAKGPLPQKESTDTRGAGRSLRNDAEDLLARSRTSLPDPEGVTPGELNHELHVHQIELEMQNEALREAHLRIEESRDKYLDLFEFAPVGYLTLTDKVLVTEANLTGAVLLGIDRNKLVKARFSKFIAENDVDTWHRYFVNVLKRGEKLTCTLALIRGDGSVFTARLDSIRMNREGSEPVVRVAITDITAEKRGEEWLKIFQTFTGRAQDIILFIRNRDGKIIEANRKALQIYGYSHDELLTMTISALRATDVRNVVESQAGEDDPPGILFETVHCRKDGSEIPVEVNSFTMQLEGEEVLFSIIRDITERRRREVFRQLSAEVLGILNVPADLPEVLRQVLDAIKRATNADAVGIRLKAGDDYPYFVQNGFSGDFLLKENTLLPGDQDEGLYRNPGGNISLECACGLVISGKTDPKNPLFTSRGSFWTNNTFPLLELAEPDDPRVHPRTTCIHAGYASVAIIPLRKNQETIFGTLQVNAFRKDCFSPGIIHSLEMIAGQITETLMREQVEVALRQALAEKEVLLSEVHHRVKNNLAAFISLLSLEGSYLDTEGGRSLRNDLQNRARSMALIHETLYRTGKFTNVDMDIYLTTLIGQIADSYAKSPRIRTEIDARGVVLDLSRATTAGLIINELVTNSFKYAFPPGFDCVAERGEPCRIRVSFAREDRTYVLTVADNGRGLPPEFDPLTAESLGLLMVNFLASHQLRAKIGIRTDNGTEFIFRLNIKEDFT